VQATCLSQGRITRCALTSPILASKISPTQNQWDYLEVLFAALSRFGAPKAIVSDGGGIFYCRQAMDVYTALGIEKPTGCATSCSLVASRDKHVPS